jgi:MoxR-like ATPase
MNQSINDLITHMEIVIKGKKNVLQKLMVALLSEGHVLIEDVPGVGKTQMVATLARTVNGIFRRIQFTPDVMPSDITGFSMFNQATRTFEYKQGVAMCNFLLADEINRASPRTQSSLLEIMEESQVTVDGVTYALPNPFMVLATQNPIENYGTYHLPEAQMYRFFLKLSIGYPTKQDELTIADSYEIESPLDTLTPLVDIQQVVQWQNYVKQIRIDNSLKAYIINIVHSTRNHPDIALGVSPRGTLNLIKAAKALAFIKGREYVLPDDIQQMAIPILAHRIIVGASAKNKDISQEEMIASIVKNIKVPVDMQVEDL